MERLRPAVLAVDSLHIDHDLPETIINNVKILSEHQRWR
jgi:hypothetical protein